MENFVFNSVKGDFGNMEIDFPADSFDLGVEGADVINGSITFNNPKLSLILSNNNLGMPFSVDLNLEAKKGNKSISIKDGDQPILNAKGADVIDVEKLETLSYTRENSNIVNFLGMFPMDSITYGGKLKLNPKLVVDIKDFKNLEGPADINRSGIEQVKCIRQLPYLADQGKEYVVNLLINKGNKEKFAKIQESVPEGYSAVSLESQDAIFTFKDQTVKLLWMNLPADPYFVVSYKLVPNEGVSEKPNMSGTFSYIENDNTLSIDIIEKDVSLQNASSENLLAVINSTVGKASEAISYTQPLDYSGKVKIEIAESALRLINDDSKLTSMLEPESGIYYRVQIAAGHRPINMNHYFKKYNLDKEVRA